MTGPGLDANYLITVYESVHSAATPTLRWTDENGIARAKSSASCTTKCQLVAFIRVKGGTQPTIETSGYTGPYTYSLYVSGLGFWDGGTSGQAGLSKVTGSTNRLQLVYTAPASISGLLVAYSDAPDGKQYFTWWDENGKNAQTILHGSPVVTPIRIAGGTNLYLFDNSVRTNVWYGLILFGIPADGDGPFGDYEFNMLDWTNASYPSWETVFTNGSDPSRVNFLVATNLAEQPNSGSVEEAMYINGFGGDRNCQNGLVAEVDGDPAGCVMPLTVQPNASLQLKTANHSGSPWGLSPTYSAEIDVLQF